MRDCVKTMARIGGRFGLTPADRAGAVFHKGKLLERPLDITPDTSNAEPQNRGIGGRLKSPISMY